MLKLERTPFTTALLLGLLHALLFWLALEPFSLWGFAFVAIVPLAMIGWRTHKPARSALGAMLGALPFWVFHHLWMANVSAAGMPAIVAYLMLYPFLFVWISARVHRRWPRIPAWALIPVVWTGLEVMRGEVAWDGYAWFLVAHPLIAAPTVHRAASAIGVYGVGFVVAILAGAMLLGIGREWRRAGMGLVAGLVVYAVSILLGSAPRPEKSIRVAAVQTNVPQDNRIAWTIEDRVRDFTTFLEQTSEAVLQAPDLILWPETMFPGSTLSPEAVETERAANLGFRGTDLTLTSFHDALMETQLGYGVPMIVGARGVEGLRIIKDEQGRFEREQGDEFNSAFVVAEGRVAATRYDKMHLTPFGEVMPYISAWPWLERNMLALGANGMSFSLAAGKSPETLDVPITSIGGNVRVAAPICYEATVEGVCRRLVFGSGQRRADLMVCVTNDGWFGTFDAGRANQVLISRWRCAELATPMVRVANTGISCAISSSGKLIRTSDDGRQEEVMELPPRVRGVLVAGVPLGSGGPTAYAVWGHWLNWPALVLMGGLLATSLGKGRGRAPD